jgi:hypothetical protein
MDAQMPANKQTVPIRRFPKAQIFDGFGVRKPAAIDFFQRRVRHES